MSSILLTWTDVEPEHEAAFNRWYDEVEIPNCLQAEHWAAVQRFQSAGRYTKPENQNPVCRYLALWELDTDDWDAAYAALRKQYEAGRWESFEPIKHRFRATYTAIGERTVSDEQRARPAPRQGLLLTFRDPAPGLEQEFNDWYNSKTEDYLTAKHWIAAQRYVMAGPHTSPENHDPVCRYLAIWDLDTDDFYDAYAELGIMAGRVLAQLGARYGEDARFRLVQHTFRATYAAIGERQEAKRPVAQQAQR